jgi:DNA-binding transcriptional MerR regulator
MKRGGGRRYYRPDDVDLLRGIRHLLYGEGYTIRGVQRILREHGGSFVQNVWRVGAEPPPGTEEDRLEGESAATEEQSLLAFPDLDDEERHAKPGAGKVRSTDAARAQRAAPPENRRKLQAALDELLTCRRIIDGALRGD